METIAFSINIVLGAFSLIPEAIWVGVLTATVALVSVVIQNRSHRKNLEIQLAKDADEKEKDRKVGYRKDVYLNYVGQSTKAFSYIGTLPFKNIATENPMMEIVGFSAAISQTGFLVDEETNLLLVNLNKQITLFMLEATSKMRPIADLHSDINILQKRFDRSINEQHRVNAEQLALNESGIQDEVRKENLQKTFEWHSKQLEIIVNEQTSCRAKVSKLQQEFMAYIPENLMPLGDLNVEILVRLRADLGIETDILKIKDEVHKARDEILEEAKRKIDALFREN